MLLLALITSLLPSTSVAASFGKVILSELSEFLFVLKSSFSTVDCV